MVSRTEVTRSHTAVPVVQRVSWGAIVAGFLVAFGLQFMLEMLGLSIGASLFEAEADNGIGTGAVIWLATSLLLSLFAGGYTAARLSGLIDEVDGMLHGIATWALVVLVNLLVLAFGASSVIGGVTSFVGSAAQGGSSFVSQFAPSVSEALPDDLAADLQQVIDQQEGALEAILNDATNTIVVDGDNELTTQEVRTAVRRFVIGNENLTEEERQAARQEAIDALAANTELSESEVEQQLDEWQQSYQQFADRAAAAAEEAAERAQEITATVAGILFAVLFVSAVAAGMGGWIGTQEYAPRVEEDEVVHRDSRDTRDVGDVGDAATTGDY